MPLEGTIMLVLTRKISERIIIGDGPNAIEIMVVDIERGRVRLGVTAPKNVPIFREELKPIDTAESPPKAT